MKSLLWWAVLGLTVLSTGVRAQEAVDTAVVAKIKAEGYGNSKAVETFTYLTTAIGPRLTNSPAHRRAIDWTQERLRSYGVSNAVPAIVLASEHYNLIARMLEQKIPVKLAVDLQTRFHDTDRNTANVIAEIPGTDPSIKSEVVMAGAHLDSWHSAAGATDNADGVTTVMEAFRILQALGVRPRRTIRLALWAGEEQGLLGSRAYVKQHLTGDAAQAARDTFSVYFNQAAVVMASVLYHAAMRDAKIPRGTLSVPGLAQGARTFKARLSPVPIDLTMQATIAGTGSATATLEANTLTISGTFQNLRSPATVARVHRAYRGTRGPAFADLKVSGGTSGIINGSIALTKEQIGDLGKSLFYVQLHSEKAPDGNLWGWLLPVEGKTK